MGSALATIAASSFMLGFSGACMPGPLLTVTVVESTRRGPWAGPLLVAGHALLEVLVVLLVLAGFGELLAGATVFTVVALVGALMLVWMSFGMLRGLSNLSLQLPGGEAQPTTLHPLASGALVSLANPYFTLWWATVGVTYLLVAGEFGSAGIVTFYLFHVLADLAWYALISFSCHYGRTLLTDRHYRALVACCALFLVGFAGYFAYAGISRYLSVWG